MKRSKSPWLISIALFAILWALVAWGLYSFVTTKIPGANDFFQRWNGAQAYWVHGLDAYSKPVALQTELYLYGHPYDPNQAISEFPGDFLYPFPVVIMLAPLVNLSYAWASAIWLALIAVGTGGIFILMADYFNWRLRPPLLAVGIIWALSFYPVTRGLFLGQVGVIAVYLQLISVWALAKKQRSLDIVAGVMLALSTIKPQVSLLLIPFLLLWGLRMQRWRFLASFGVMGLILAAVSFVLQPNWLGEWLQQVSAYTGYTQPSTLELITGVYLPFLGSTGQLFLTGALLIVLAWAWYHALWRQKADWFSWTVALTFVITNLVLVRTATPHYVAFLFILVFYFKQMIRRRNGVLIVLGAMLLLNLALWLFFLVNLKGDLEAAVVPVPLPIALLILLLATRPLWLKANTATGPTNPAKTTVVAPVATPVLDHAR
jgi:hypothetical protein